MTAPRVGLLSYIRIIFTRHCSPVFSLHSSPEVRSLANVQQNVLSDVTFLSETFGAGGSDMQVSSRVHQTVKTGESVVVPQIKNRGPCPGCKQYLPQLKLGPFIKHRHHCKSDMDQRDVSCSPPARNTNNSVSKKKILPRSFQNHFGKLAIQKHICRSTRV